jgi:hypothetical protein
MLIKGNCKKCSQSIGIVQYADYYTCSCEWGMMVCPTCYKNNTVNCPNCGKKLEFHSGAATKKWQQDNGIMF